MSAVDTSCPPPTAVPLCTPDIIKSGRIMEIERQLIIAFGKGREFKNCIEDAHSLANNLKYGGSLQVHRCCVSSHIVLFLKQHGVQRLSCGLSSGYKGTQGFVPVSSGRVDIINKLASLDTLFTPHQFTLYCWDGAYAGLSSGIHEFYSEGVWHRKHARYIRIATQNNDTGVWLFETVCTYNDFTHSRRITNFHITGYGYVDPCPIF